MYKKICLGLLLCAGNLAAMDTEMDGDVLMSGLASAAPLGMFATPPSTPGRTPKTPMGPVKLDFGSRVVKAREASQIFLEMPEGPAKRWHANEAREIAASCLSFSRNDNLAAELRDIIVRIDAYLSRPTSPTLYAPSSVGRMLFSQSSASSAASGGSLSDSDSSDSESDSDNGYSSDESM